MTGLLRRSVIVGSTLAVALTVTAPYAFAEDLPDVLERAQSSTYTATRLTVSVWGDHTSLVRERVEHSDGSEMIRVDETWSMVGNGRTIRMGDAPSGFAFVSSSAPVETDRYEIGEPTPCTHLRRRCTLMTIREGDRIRERMVVDALTGAPLITYVYDGDGETYRTVSLSDFSPHRTYEWPESKTHVPLEVVMHDEGASLPPDLDGYQLVDVFNAPASSDQGFYSDGLFSFSLFIMPVSTTVAGFDDATVMSTDRGSYDVMPTARDVRVHWVGDGRNLVLVGDLPPDHLTEVLAELPAPQGGNVLARIWRALFG